jgi:hypothetical protein
MIQKRVQPTAISGGRLAARGYRTAEVRVALISTKDDGCRIARSFGLQDGVDCEADVYYAREAFSKRSPIGQVSGIPGSFRIIAYPF